MAAPYAGQSMCAPVAGSVNLICVCPGVHGDAGAGERKSNLFFGVRCLFRDHRARHTLCMCFHIV